MTRARERLIVSGSVDFGKASEVPTPIAWVLERLEADEELAAAGDTPLELVRGDARLLVRVDRYREEKVAADESRAPKEGQLALFASLDDVGPAVEAGAAPAGARRAVAAPPLLRVRRLSFTALSMFEQCGYKYWARYGIGLAEQEVPRGEGGLSGVEVGSARPRAPRAHRPRRAGRAGDRGRARARARGRVRRLAARAPARRRCPA